MDRDELSGKVAMITGAAQGIGYGLAAKFHVSGCSVWMTDINLAGVNQASGEIDGGKKERIGSCWIDVCDEVSVGNAVSGCVERFGRIDILINNAGIVMRGRVEEMDIEKWRKVVDINLSGSFLCSKAVIPHMKKMGGGVILNVSSVSARVPGIGLSAYCCAKAANEMLTKVLAAEVAPYGIRVNAYAPGVTRTAMTEMMIEQRGEEKLDQIALQRFGEIDDLGELAIFLCSDRSSWITGEIVHIDGGTMIVGCPWKAWQDGSSPG